MLKRLLDCEGSLTWSQNQCKEWCIQKSQFDMFVATPCRAPKEDKASSSYPADATRTWEHSITAGHTFFQEDCELMVWNGRFEYSQLKRKEALKVLENPCKAPARAINLLEFRGANMWRK